MQTLCIYNPHTAKIVDRVDIADDTICAREMAKIRLLLKCKFPCEVVAIPPLKQNKDQRELDLSILP